jgi:hypothetical protein
MRWGVFTIGIVLLVVANVFTMLGWPRFGMSAEGFTSYFLENAASTGSEYQPMSSFDGAKVETGNSVSSWRYVKPDEKPTAPWRLDEDNLFIFKNNQCKPECCASSLSCDGGCVCTTPEQRQFIATRGGNHSTDN